MCRPRRQLLRMPSQSTGQLLALVLPVTGLSLVLQPVGFVSPHTIPLKLGSLLWEEMQGHSLPSPGVVSPHGFPAFAQGVGGWRHFFCLAGGPVDSVGPSLPTVIGWALFIQPPYPCHT